MRNASTNRSLSPAADAASCRRLSPPPSIDDRSSTIGCASGSPGMFASAVRMPRPDNPTRRTGASTDASNTIDTTPLPHTKRADASGITRPAMRAAPPSIRSTTPLIAASFPLRTHRGASASSSPTTAYAPSHANGTSVDMSAGHIASRREPTMTCIRRVLSPSSPSHYARVHALCPAANRFRPPCARILRESRSGGVHLGARCSARQRCTEQQRPYIESIYWDSPVCADETRGGRIDDMRL